MYAIGGIQPGDIQSLTAMGVYGIAVSGIITHHPDKKLLLKQLNAVLS